ncbi:MAG: AsmA family protein, partial [Pseudomonadota bacterium]
MLKKLAYGLLGIVAVVVILLFAVPPIINWNAYVPEISDGLKEATGHELTVDGEIKISVLPSLTFEASDIKLTNPTAKEASTLVQVGAVSGEIAVLQLLQKRLEVRSFLIQSPKISVQVDENGQSNWTAEAGSAAASQDPEKESESADAEADDLPLSEIILSDVALMDGALTYQDAASGQQIIAESIQTKITLPALASALSVAGGATINGKPATWSLDLDTPESLLRDGTGSIKSTLEAEVLTFDLNSGLALRPLAGLNGDAKLSIPSVGELTQWIGNPLEQDPGPLELTVTFAHKGGTTGIEKAQIDGQDLNATLSATYQQDEDKSRFDVKLDGQTLDFTRYLPATKPEPHERPKGSARKGEPKDGNPLDQPLDLAWLDQLEGTLAVAVEKIITREVAAGPIAFRTEIADGKLGLDLSRLGLYGGDVTAKAQLSKAGKGANLSAQGSVSKLPTDQFFAAQTQAEPDSPPVVSGEANGTFDLKAEGGTPRALLSDLQAQLDFSLAPDGNSTTTAMLSDVKVKLSRAGFGEAASLDGQVTLFGQQVTVTGQAVPPEKLDSGPLSLTGQVASDLVMLDMSGEVELGADRTSQSNLTFSTPSYQALNAWIAGLPLAENAADFDDPLSLEGEFTSAKEVLEIVGIAISGPAIDLKAKGRVTDENGKPSATLEIDGDRLDLDYFLASAPGSDQATATPIQDGDPAATADPLAALSDEPFDLAPLQAVDADLKVTLRNITMQELVVDLIDTTLVLDDGDLKATIASLQSQGAKLAGEVTVSDDDSALALDTKIDLSFSDKTINDRNRDQRAFHIQKGLKGQFTFAAKGPSPRGVAESLSGEIDLTVPGLEPVHGPISQFLDGSFQLKLPAATEPAKVDGKVTMIVGEEATEVPLAVNLVLPPLPDLIKGNEGPVDLGLAIANASLKVKGQVAQLLGDPVVDLTIELDSPETPVFRALFPEFPDIHPVKLTGHFAASPEAVSLRDFVAGLGPSDLSGEISFDRTAAPPFIQANVSSKVLDLSRFQSGQKEATDDQEADTAKSGSEDDNYLFKDDPLPFDRLSELDAKVTVDVGDLKVNTDLSLTKVDLDLVLQDAVAKADPVAFGLNKGRFEGTARLDAAKEPADIALDFTVDSFDMVVSPEVQMTLDGHTELTAQGNSPRQLASSVTGISDWISREGTVDSSFLGILTFGTGSILSPLFGGKPNSAFECMVARLKMSDGLVTPEVAVVDAQDLILSGEGTVNLKDETLNMSLATGTRTISLADLAVPISISGSLRSPTALPDAVGGAKKLTSTAMSLANPVNALNTIFGTEIPGGKEAPCPVAFMAIADTKAPADLTVSQKPKESTGVVGGAVNSLESGL